MELKPLSNCSYRSYKIPTAPTALLQRHQSPNEQPSQMQPVGDSSAPPPERNDAFFDQLASLMGWRSKGLPTDSEAFYRLIRRCMNLVEIGAFTFKWGHIRRRTSNEHVEWEGLWGHSTQMSSESNRCHGKSILSPAQMKLGYRWLCYRAYANPGFI